MVRVWGMGYLSEWCVASGESELAVGGGIWQ
jgi:hypothetical protein